MELRGRVFDDIIVVGFGDSIYIIGCVALAELRVGARAAARRAYIHAVVVLDGEFAVLLPEAPHAVGRESLLAEAHAVDGAVVVHHLARAISLGGSVGDVVPMHVALGADCREREGFGQLNLYREVGKHHALQVRSREGERHARFGEARLAVRLRRGGCGVARAAGEGERQARAVSVVGKGEAVAVDHVARGGGERVRGIGRRAGEKLHVVVLPVHVVGIRREGELRRGSAFPDRVVRGVFRSAVVERAVELVNGIGQHAGRLFRLRGVFDEELAARVAAVATEVALRTPVVYFIAEAGLRLIELHRAAADDVVALRVGIAQRPACRGLRRGGLDLGVVGCGGAEVRAVLAVDDVECAVRALHELPHRSGRGGGAVGAHDARCAGSRGGNVIVGQAQRAHLIPVLLALRAFGGQVQSLCKCGVQGVCHVGGFRFRDRGMSEQFVGLLCFGIECSHTGFAILSHAFAQRDNIPGSQCLADGVAALCLSDVFGGGLFGQHVEGFVREIGGEGILDDVSHLDVAQTVEIVRVFDVFGVCHVPVEERRVAVYILHLVRSQLREECVERGDAAGIDSGVVRRVEADYKDSGLWGLGHYCFDYPNVV